MAAAAILKNRKITIFRPRFDGIRPNLAWRRSSAFVSVSTVKNLKFLTVGRLWNAELRRRTKFGRNRSKRGPDMAIFRFFQDGGRPPSWICYVCVRTTHEGYLVVFIAVRNLVGIDAVVLIICMFFDFTSLA